MTLDAAAKTMKAYVWCQSVNDGGGGWEYYALNFVRAFKLIGLETQYDISPTPQRIYEQISDIDVKCYVGIGHGTDHSATTGKGSIYPINFEEVIRRRGQPLTIGIAIHCGTPHPYTPGRWLTAMTLDDPRVVGERWDGSGWAVRPADRVSLAASWYSSTTINFMSQGYTYEEASELAYENTDQTAGLRQGNKDLKLWYFYDGYPVGWFVDPVLYYANEDGKITLAGAVKSVNDYFKGYIPRPHVIKVISAYFGR